MLRLHAASQAGSAHESRTQVWDPHHNYSDCSLLARLAHNHCITINEFEKTPEMYLLTHMNGYSRLHMYVYTTYIGKPMLLMPAGVRPAETATARTADLQ